MPKKKRVSDRVRETPTEYRVPRRLSATEASRNFSELLNRVRYRGESFIIERGGEPICELKPVAPPRFTGADLVTLFRSLPPVDEGYLSAVEEISKTQPFLPESPWER
jgi:antitoxin (DNA-binding transcriptional repressor) of toxin-antitoxin stability system